MPTVQPDATEAVLLDGGRPLTIALLLESDGPGGAEVMVLEMARELQARGHRVVPIGPEAGQGWLGERLSRLGLSQLGVKKHHPLSHRWILDLRRLFKERNVDIVHAHEFTMAVFGTAAARSLGIPVVSTLHGSQNMTRALRRRIALRCAIRGAHATVAVSRATKTQLEADLGSTATSVRVIRNGVPVREGNRKVTRGALGVQDRELLILAVGTLEERKAHLLLLQALAALPPEARELPWKVAIACGRGGPMQAAIEEYIRRHQLGDRVQILMYRDDVPDLLAAADIFAMPSLWEGLPLALLEAMVAGKAIVASQTSGIPEAVEHGVGGLLVKPGDINGLSMALNELLSDVALRARLGTQAGVIGRERFTIAAMVDQYVDLYRQVDQRR